MLIEMDDNDKSPFAQPPDRSLFHKMKSPLNSSSASVYRLTEHPFFTRRTTSKDPLISCLWRRKNSRTYRLIRFRKVAGPISFFTTIPSR